ncbi:MAG: hypothetical protein GY822_23585 [Deltaproteobacteria bacterium]|nr:hypothetical protein [Deltaproteobacteria bacterium]
MSLVGIIVVVGQAGCGSGDRAQVFANISALDDANLHGVVTLTGLPPEQGKARVVFEFKQVDNASLLFNGERLMPKPGELKNGEVLLTLSSSGALNSAAVMRALPPIAKGVAEQIFSAANVFHGTKPASNGQVQFGDSVEIGPFGDFLVEYIQYDSGRKGTGESGFYTRHKLALTNSEKHDENVVAEADLELGKGFVRNKRFHFDFCVKDQQIRISKTSL